MLDKINKTEGETKCTNKRSTATNVFKLLYPLSSYNRRHLYRIWCMWVCVNVLMCMYCFHVWVYFNLLSLLLALFMLASAVFCDFIVSFILRFKMNSKAHLYWLKQKSHENRAQKIRLVSWQCRNYNNTIKWMKKQKRKKKNTFT